MDLIADTTFLVGLWRKQAWARRYAHANQSKTIGLPWIVLGEFWHGATLANHDPATIELFLQIGIPVCDPVPVIPVYERMCARLQTDAAEAYKAIGQNDLWIAAVALYLQKPLVSRNRRHFDVVKGLELIVPEKG